ncbi:Gfo/Idh/MocA family oxidoreductase [Planctomicrobium sp. SH661]|uniref:Gfo/Idh/MocA family oxidoreductase n=1 Tax=Planctomicrobium sp. SH661 TaxID=3448124 RepID=UPI003F5BCC40
MFQQASRREFMATSASLGAAVWVGGSIARGEDRSPNAKIRYACIGLGGKGGSDSADAAAHGEIVAVCDIDDRTLEKVGSRPGFENAARFFDYREMFDKMGDKIDAVTVSTPDHMHAPATAHALKLGKACFTQKPLTHTVWEARRLQEIAKAAGVATQMGNQGTANESGRRSAVFLQQGGLGKVKEVHVFTNRPIWPQGGARPASSPVPPFVHWEEWLGAAPERPYAEGYHPFAWRGYWDFGTGALGDMACHTFNMPFAGLNLANPKSIEATCTGHNMDSFPQASKIAFEFAHPSGEGILPVWWYDGGNLPDESLLNGQKFRSKGGAIIVGEDLTMYSSGDYGDQWILIDKDGKEVPNPEIDLEKSPGHFTEFHQAVTGERKKATSNFAEYAGPLTETILLGNLAIADAAKGSSRKLLWDAEKLEVTNAPELSSLVNKPYRNHYDEYLKA